MFDNRREIMQDVFLTYLPAQRFKTSRMTVQLIAPLQRETAAANALLPAVLRRGTVRCPDMESLSAALDTLYGANIDYTVRKKGERQCVGFAAGFIDDAFTPHGEKLLEPVSAMLGELLLDPVTHGGRFLSSYVESEKANLIDAIRALKNDKRDWADIRLMQEMCAGEPYSVLRLGDEETAGRITNQSLYVHGQELMLSKQRAEIQNLEDMRGAYEVLLKSVTATSVAKGLEAANNSAMEEFNASMEEAFKGVQAKFIAKFGKEEGVAYFTRFREGLQSGVPELEKEAKEITKNLIRVHSRNYNYGRQSPSCY